MGGDLVALASDNTTFSSGFYRISRKDGRVEPLLEENRQLGSAYAANSHMAIPDRGSRVIFVAESASEPRELWAGDGDLQHATRISHLAGEVWKIPVGPRRIVEWRRGDGKIAQGLLMLPPGYDPHRRYPMVMWVYHRSLVYAQTFGLTDTGVFNCHLLTTRGIACLYPNLELTPLRVMASLGDQITAAMHAMVEQGIADPDRIGIEGHSSGGYDVLAAIATVPTIRAAVASAGIADILSFYGIDAIGPDWAEKQMGIQASPWAAPERYMANSPSFHFDRVRTPLLIMQGTADASCATQMDIAYGLLRRLGKQVEYRRYVNEGHVPDSWSLANRLDITRRLLDWWQHYLIPDCAASCAPDGH